jgi:hypothetical protein
MLKNFLTDELTFAIAIGCEPNPLGGARGFATTNMSIAAMSVRWLCRKLRQVGEGTLGRHGMYLSQPWPG